MFGTAEVGRLKSRPCQSRVARTIELIELNCFAELNSKVWFRRRPSALLLSNLIPEFSFARQKHDFWTGPSSKCLQYFPVTKLLEHKGPPLWRIHTELCKFAQNISTNICKSGKTQSLKAWRSVFFTYLYNIIISSLYPLHRFRLRFSLCDTEKDLYSFNFVTLDLNKETETFSNFLFEKDFNITDTETRMEFGRFFVVQESKFNNNEKDLCIASIL